jgi:DNA-binding transcriptional regulator LsrR (DeoR family)
VITPSTSLPSAIELDQLRRIPRVVALAGGKKKTSAIEAALRSSIIKVLVADRFTAARLVGEDE